MPVRTNAEIEEQKAANRARLEQVRKQREIDRIKREEQQAQEEEAKKKQEEMLEQMKAKQAAAGGKKSRMYK